MTGALYTFLWDDLAHSGYIENRTSFKAGDRLGMAVGLREEEGEWGVYSLANYTAVNEEI